MASQSVYTKGPYTVDCSPEVLATGRCAARAVVSWSVGTAVYHQRLATPRLEFDRAEDALQVAQDTVTAWFAHRCGESPPDLRGED